MEFNPIDKIPELMEKLRINGGEARFDFWDGSLNKIIKP